MNCNKNIKFHFKPGITIVFVGIFVLSFFYACEELPCQYGEGVKLNAGFFTLDGTNLNETTIDTLTLVIMNTADNPYEEVFHKGVETLSFPLSIIDDSSTIILKYKDLMADTLIFRHTGTVVLINHECGFETFFNIDTILTTNHKIESVWVSNATVNYDQSENIKIYF